VRLLSLSQDMRAGPSSFSGIVASLVEVEPAEVGEDMVERSDGVVAPGSDTGHHVVAILGRGRLPSDVAGELMAVLADQPPVVVCELDGLAAAGAAVGAMFAPVAEYLRIWPGTVVVVVVHDRSLREQLMGAAQDRLLVRASLIAGVADAGAMRLRVKERRMRLAPLPSQVPEARAFVTRSLQSWGLADLVGPAVLVVSELVTNSVLHAVTVLDVAVSTLQGRVRVAVHDHAGGAPRAHPGQRLEDDVGGRGLQLVQAVTRGWGVLPGRRGGKTVWAVLDQVPVVPPWPEGSETASPRPPTVSAVPRERFGSRAREGALSMLPQDWASLIALLDGRPDADPITRAQRLCEVCTQATGVSGVSLGIAADGQRSTVIATDEVSDRLEELQTTVAEGPSIEAFRNGWPVLVPNLADRDEERWPWFRSEAVEAGARAMFALPLRVAAIRLGALTLYRSTAGDLNAGQLKDAKTLAEAGSILLSLDQPGENTASAFMWVVGDRSRFRAEVYQAVGRTMVHLEVDARDAFARICAYAYAGGRPIGEVADDIMDKRLRLDRDEPGPG
jgi:anti-sigma regulatory factor (Ser/Thr protein kinase)